MKIALQFATVVSLWGCATTNISYLNVQSVETSIRGRDDAAALRQINDLPSLTEIDASWLIDVSVKDGQCRDGLVAAILAKSPASFRTESSLAARVAHRSDPSQPILDHPGAGILGILIHASCPNAIKLLFPRITHDEIALAVNAGYRKKYEEIADDVTRGSPPENLRAVGETYRLVRAKIEENCNSDGTISSSCATRKMLYEMQAYVDSRKKDVESRESPAGIMAAACDVLREKTRVEAMIDQEKRVGEVSGAVNVSNLHTLGMVVVGSEQRLKILSAKYQSAAGKPIDMSTCPSH